jgi:M3 family oligoendopeptidase
VINRSMYMKFNSIPYIRPDIKKIQSGISKLLCEFKNSPSPTHQINTIYQINQIRNQYETASEIVHIRHTTFMEDSFYIQETTFFDETKPLFESCVAEFYKVIMTSRFKKELREHFGRYYFKIVGIGQKIFSDSIIEDLQLENQLMSKYTTSISQARILFQGSWYNLEQIIPFYESEDRSTRISAYDAVAKFWESKEAFYDELFDQLVRVRHRIANKLKFDNFIPLGYLRLQRTDYKALQIARFREQILQKIVPLTILLRKDQKKTLGLDSLSYYDEAIYFPNGNSRPIGDAKTILSSGISMYEEMSSKTREFIQWMVERDLLDLETRTGKAPGGYCTYLNDYEYPFIFSNFNGTSEDVDVLTHEAGHAFAAFCNKQNQIPEFVWPTLDVCEIHSMSMEFFAWPWMHLFFGDKAEQYRSEHLRKAILFIPYAALVDEFQHQVYENPNMTPKERRSCWRILEKKYLPYRDYSGNRFLEDGGFWFRQGHIFKNPFYYIDYALAEICAMLFLIESIKDRNKAWNKYIQLCEKGGSVPFLELISNSELGNPFNPNTLERIIKEIQQLILNNL